MSGVGVTTDIVASPQINPGQDRYRPHGAPFARRKARRRATSRSLTFTWVCLTLTSTFDFGPQAFDCGPQAFYFDLDFWLSDLTFKTQIWDGAVSSRDLSSVLTFDFWYLVLTPARSNCFDLDVWKNSTSKKNLSNKFPEKSILLVKDLRIQKN